MAKPYPRLKPLWWLYFVLWLLLHVAALFIMPGGGVFDFLWFCLGSLELLAVAGYLLQRPFLVRSVWMAVWPIVFAVPVATVGYGLLSQPHDAPVESAMVAVLLLAVVAPAVWASFAYAFRSDHLWVRERVGTGDQK